MSIFHGPREYPKGFALCRQPLLVPQAQSERVELEILRILLRRWPEILILEPKSAPRHFGENLWYQNGAEVTPK